MFTACAFGEIHICRKKLYSFFFFQFFSKRHFFFTRQISTHSSVAENKMTHERESLSSKRKKKNDFSFGKYFFYLELFHDFLGKYFGREKGTAAFMCVRSSYIYSHCNTSIHIMLILIL